MNTILPISVGFILVLVSCFYYTILQAFNVETGKDLLLNGPVVQVNAIGVGNEVLLRGTSVSNLL